MTIQNIHSSLPQTGRSQHGSCIVDSPLHSPAPTQVLVNVSIPSPHEAEHPCDTNSVQAARNRFFLLKSRKFLSHATV